MATEAQIRAAIAAVITTATAALIPPPIIIPRDILNVFDTGWMNLLRDADGLGVIHGWTITQSGASVSEERGRGAEYEYTFEVWQWYQYATGTNAANSEDQMSAERELVLVAFAAPLLPPVSTHAALDGVHALEFPPGSIGTPEIDFRGHVRVARGILRVSAMVGC